MKRSRPSVKLTSPRKVATIESAGSSTRIEGFRFTDPQVDKLLGLLHITEFKTRELLFRLALSFTFAFSLRPA